MRRHFRRNARPGENQIPTVRIVRKRNPRRVRRFVRRNAPITAAQAAVMKSILAAHGFLSNPRRGTRRGKKKHMARHRKVRRNPKPPKGKRAGSVFKRKGKYFRVVLKKVRKGRRVVRRRIVRKITARAAKRSRK